MIIDIGSGHPTFLWAAEQAQKTTQKYYKLYNVRYKATLAFIGVVFLTVFLYFVSPVGLNVNAALYLLAVSVR